MHIIYSYDQKVDHTITSFIEILTSFGLTQIKDIRITEQRELPIHGGRTQTMVTGAIILTDHPLPFIDKLLSEYDAYLNKPESQDNSIPDRLGIQIAKNQTLASILNLFNKELDHISENEEHDIQDLHEVLLKRYIKTFPEYKHKILAEYNKP